MSLAKQMDATIQRPFKEQLDPISLIAAAVLMAVIAWALFDGLRVIKTWVAHN